MASAARVGAVPALVLGSSAALGYLQAKGHLNKLPTIGGSRAMTLAIAGFALTRFTKNPMLRTFGSAAMIVGAFDMGSKAGGGKSALEGESWFEGEDDVSGWDEGEV